MSWFFPFDRDTDSCYDHDTTDAPAPPEFDLEGGATRSILTALALSSRAFEMRCRSKGCHHPAESVVAASRDTPRPFCRACAGAALEYADAREYPLEAFARAPGERADFKPAGECDGAISVELTDGEPHSWLHATNYDAGTGLDRDDGFVDLGGMC